MGVLCIVAFFFFRRREPTERTVRAYLGDCENVYPPRDCGQTSGLKSPMLYYVCFDGEKIPRSKLPGLIFQQVKGAAPHTATPATSDGNADRGNARV